MARWDARIRKKLKKLKVGRNKVEEGVYIDTNVFDEFVSWLHAKKFQEPASNELKKSAFLSPLDFGQNERVLGQKTRERDRERNSTLFCSSLAGLGAGLF